jgi:hypothetical protein
VSDCRVIKCRRTIGSLTEPSTFLPASCREERWRVIPMEHELPQERQSSLRASNSLDRRHLEGFWRGMAKPGGTKIPVFSAIRRSPWLATHSNHVHPKTAYFRCGRIVRGVAPWGFRQKLVRGMPAVPGMARGGSISPRERTSTRFQRGCHATWRLHSESSGSFELGLFRKSACLCFSSDSASSLNLRTRLPSVKGLGLRVRAKVKGRKSVMRRRPSRGAGKGMGSLGAALEFIRTGGGLQKAKQALETVEEIRHSVR